MRLFLCFDRSRTYTNKSCHSSPPTPRLNYYKEESVKIKGKGPSTPHLLITFAIHSTHHQNCITSPSPIHSCPSTPHLLITFKLLLLITFKLLLLITFSCFSPQLLLLITFSYFSPQLLLLTSLPSSPRASF